MCIGMANGGKTPQEKIKAIYPHIVVGGDIDKPYYNIHWYDIEQKTMICGFGSYKLELVRKWLEEEFEVVERDIDNLIKSQETEIEKYKNGIKKLVKKYQLYKENKIATREYEIEQTKIIEAGKKVFKATINKILSIEGHYVNIDGEFIEIESPELLDELENLFGMEFCEFNEDYEENLENLVIEMVGDDK